MRPRFDVRVLAALALGLAACGSDGGDAVRPAASTTTGSSETAAPTSTEASTTTTTTTTPATTTSTPGARGWVPLSIGAVTGQAFPPCCADTWHGVASPPLPAADEPLADGAYAAQAEWSVDPRDPLLVEVRRFEQCNRLPSTACDDSGSEYPDEALGIDESTVFSWTVPLDDTTRVVLVGFQGWDMQSDAIVVAEGTGADLAELAAAVDVAYTEVLWARFTQGEAPADIVADVAAHPIDGWGPGADGSTLSLTFTYADAPPLLFQAPFGFEPVPTTEARGTDVLRIVSLEVVDGALTLYVYAGYYS